ncbi:hypothetical protein BDV41DRAFT_590693 [Aspergillus transmontanensis]|uniref:Uncharacterized protein n=1 Tax=Aspergillus transmontanensis TaxID=1034304 RepID=A0A5N6VND6_9EURO|nr:hypothetical protein BDV41DRAFT_590693 [Aspergillus transmontanensis]
MRLLWSLAWLALTVCANAFRPGPQLEKRISHLVKRSRPKCGPKLALAETVRLSASNSSNVSVGFIRFERNTTALQKRMELPDDNIGEFYGRELPHLTELIVPHEEAPTAEEMSTGVMKTFSSVKRRQQYSTGTAHLSGCTTMYIISHKDQTNDEIFQATVIDMLRNGGRYHPKLDKNLIEDDYIRAYLIRPATAWNEEPGGVGYPQRWAQIRTTVGELVPKLQDTSLWTEIPYNALNNNAPELDEEDGTHGKNLFKYDPLHIFESGLKGPLAMLWVEDELTPYHEDHW